MRTGQTSDLRIEKTQMELQTAELSLDVQTRELQEDLTETFNQTCAAIEEIKHEFQAQLEVVETRTEQGNAPMVGAGIAQPLTFNGNSLFHGFPLLI
jgi:hypothetical protein